MLFFGNGNYIKRRKAPDMQVQEENGEKKISCLCIHTSGVSFSLIYLPLKRNGKNKNPMTLYNHLQKLLKK